MPCARGVPHPRVAPRPVHLRVGLQAAQVRLPPARLDDRVRAVAPADQEDRVVDPLAGLFDWIGVEVSDVCPTRLVLVAQPGQIQVERSSGWTGQAIVTAAIDKLRSRGVTDDEIRRLFEAELSGMYAEGKRRE